MPTARTCLVSFTDSENIRHAAEVSATTLYEAAARSPWDNPLSSRLDENDALMIYDNVFVPWERVFVYRDVELAYLQWWDTPSFVHWIHQSATRYWTKLEFLAGLAIKVARANGVDGRDNPLGTCVHTLRVIARHAFVVRAVRRHKLRVRRSGQRRAVMQRRDHAHSLQRAAHRTGHPRRRGA